jgi:hypothetical protein
VGQGRRRIFLRGPWKPELFISFHALQDHPVSYAGNDAEPGIQLR